MSGIVSLVKRYSMAVFLVLTYAFSWCLSLLYLWDGETIAVLAFGPFLAALVVLSLTVGKPGVMALLRSMVKWRVGWRWWLVALGLPPLLNFLGSYLAVLFGAPAPTMAQLAEWPNILIMFPIFLLLPGVGGAWEEPGWRGFALPRLEKGRSRLWALLPLWIILVVWHIPLFISGNANWIDSLNMVGGVIVFNWLYHRSGQSVLLVMVIHAMNNTISDYLFPMFTGVYRTDQVVMKSLAWGIVAVIVLVGNWRWWTETEEHQVEEPRPVLKAA